MNNVDATSWPHVEASGLVTNKVYADGLGPKYEYDAKGNLTKRTWARGVETFYAYDGWGNMTNTSYSDDTPAVSLVYDAMGRQREAHDAAGTTTFTYDDFGANTNETVIGVAGTNIIERFYDTFGRSLGYSLNGERRTTLSYEQERGRIASMLAAGSTNEFRWSYLPGSDLKESLEYPNGDVVRWEYEPKRDLLTLVSNATHSTYRYTYDEAGRRISKNDEHYGYNVRNELILATNVVTGSDFAYCYDDIGNRLWSREFGTNTTYAANNLNQYTEIVRGGVVEHPAFDADGSQTDITTGTGRWLVEYNGENRPIRWTRAADGAVIEMSYDRMGRRVCSGEDMFVYDGYLNIGSTIWDPAEPEATKPLIGRERDVFSYYLHDGNKNVVQSIEEQNLKHYAYTPFGQILCDVTDTENSWRFSSECLDVIVGANYYNFRHLDSRSGRWLSRESVDLNGRNMNLFLFCRNDVCGLVDMLGLLEKCPNGAKVRKQGSNCSYRSMNDNGNPKKTNGCGAEGGPSVPNSFFYIIDFTGCCNTHDMCYGTCDQNKAACDGALGLCMSGKCTPLMGLPIMYDACVAQALTYAAAVLAAGGDAYENAQDSACIWQPCCCDE